MTSNIISKFSKVKQKNMHIDKSKNNKSDIFNIMIQRGGVILTCVKNFDFNLKIIKILSICLIIVTILDIILKLKKFFIRN